MPDRLSVYVHRCLSLLRCQIRRLAHAAQARWRLLQRRWHGPSLVVMVADRRCRRAVEREVRCGLRRLTHALTGDGLDNLTIVVQHVIVTDHPLAGCYSIGQRADNSPFTLLRLALSVSGRRLSTDEILAALTEQYLGLVLQQSGGMSVTIPVELDVVSPTPVSSPHLNGDPLAPSSNGCLPRPKQPPASAIRKE